MTLRLACCRYLDDVALHHLIDALCQLCSESIEIAYANKVNCQCRFLTVTAAAVCLLWSVRFVFYVTHLYTICKQHLT